MLAGADAVGEVATPSAADEAEQHCVASRDAVPTLCAPASLARPLARLNNAAASGDPILQWFLNVF